MGNNKLTARDFFKLLVLFYIFILPSAFPIAIFHVFEILPGNITNNFEISQKTFLYVVIIAPILEELIFRLPLRISSFSFSISISILILVITKLLVCPTIGYEFYLLAIPLTFLLNAFYSHKKSLLAMIKAFWGSHFKYIFYSFSIIFGLLHLSNFEEIYWWMIVFSPLITLPHIIMGLFLGFIRMNFSFLHALIFHATINFISSAPSIAKFMLS
jgi:hypothetical protein